MADRTVDDVVQMVRAHLRDYPELNRLIAGEESGNGMIKLAIGFTVDRWNTSPPFIGAATVASFPSESLLIMGTIVNLWDQVLALSLRNFSTIRDAGGVSDVDGANVPYMQRELTTRKQVFMQELSRMKKAVNISAALGQSGLHSEYH